MATKRAPRRCGDCRRPLGKDAHPSRRYCKYCRPPRGRAKLEQAEPTEPAGVPGYPDEYVGPISAQLEESIRAATDRLTPMDHGLVQAARYLAKKIDTEDLYRQKILDAQIDAGERPQLPPLDNVSIPTFLKYCESLGLSPAGRIRIDGPKKEGSTSGGKRGKLEVLRGGTG